MEEEMEGVRRVRREKRRKNEGKEGGNKEGDRKEKSKGPPISYNFPTLEMYTLRSMCYAYHSYSFEIKTNLPFYIWQSTVTHTHTPMCGDFSLAWSQSDKPTVLEMTIKLSDLVSIPD